MTMTTTPLSSRSHQGVGAGGQDRAIDLVQPRGQRAIDAIRWDWLVEGQPQVVLMVSYSASAASMRASRNSILDACGTCFVVDVFILGYLR
jgi:hypothetical protein